MTALPPSDSSPIHSFFQLSLLKVVAVLLTHLVFIFADVSTVRALMVYSVLGMREVALKKLDEVLVWWMLFM